MEYIVEGGHQLQGTIELAGAKNVALKLIIAALLVKGTSTITNVPRIRDVLSLIDIVNYLGGTVRFTDEHTIAVTNTLTKYGIPFEYGARTRVSFMLIAPLLFTFKKAIIPNPGGCRLGARPVDRLVNSIKEFGAEVTYNHEDGYYYATLENPHCADIQFKKKTHTGTELALMMAARITGTSTITNAAKEPEIDDLITFLNHGGAAIKQVGNQLRISGKNMLESSTIQVQYDRNEAVSFIVLSALFNGKIIVKNVDINKITSFLHAFKQAGFSYSDSNNEFIITPPKSTKAVDIETAPHPGFMTDWQPLWALLMTQAEGKSTIHETVFEDRFGYVEELKKFGAKVSFYQPEVLKPKEFYQFNVNVAAIDKQAIALSGPTNLHNADVKMTDIRAGASMLMAALLANGKSLIEGVEQIERGYENLAGRLQQLGAKITPVQV